jgi:hypothetical protein
MKTKLSTTCVASRKYANIIMAKRLSSTLALVAVLIGIEGAADVRTALAAHRQNPEVVAVRVDGVLYSRAEYEEHFGHLDLHWVVNDAARARGILIAFTTLENRDAALGRQRDASSQPEDAIQQVDVSYQVCLGPNGTGGCQVFTDSVDTLGAYDNAITSVYTRDRAITLYDLSHPRRGCTLYVQTHKAIGHLAGHDFCGLSTGDWNNKTSAIGLER